MSVFSSIKLLHFYERSKVGLISSLLGKVDWFISSVLRGREENLSPSSTISSSLRRRKTEFSTIKRSYLSSSILSMKRRKHFTLSSLLWDVNVIPLFWEKKPPFFISSTRSDSPFLWEEVWTDLFLSYEKREAENLRFCYEKVKAGTYFPATKRLRLGTYFSATKR